MVASLFSSTARSYQGWFFNVWIPQINLEILSGYYLPLLCNPSGGISYIQMLDWPSGSISSKIHLGYILFTLELNWEVNSECRWTSQMELSCTLHHHYLFLSWIVPSLTELRMCLTCIFLFQIAWSTRCIKVAFV